MKQYSYDLPIYYFIEAVSNKKEPNHITKSYQLPNYQ